MKDPLKYFADIVQRTAEQSRCKRRQVGAILVIDNRIVAEGWNSPPEGTNISNCPACNSDNVESGKGMETRICTHAEINCLLNAFRSGINIKNGYPVLVCTCYPCSECAKAIVTAGIEKIYYGEDYPSDLTDMILKNAKVESFNYNKILQQDPY